VIPALVGLCVLAGALCAAVELALAEASRARLDDLLEGERRRHIDRLLERDHELSLCAGFYRAVFQIGAVALAAASAAPGRLVAVIAWAAVFILLVSELAPRVLVARSPERILTVLLPAFHIVALPVLPLAAGAVALGRFARNRHAEGEEDEDEAAEDILSAVTEGEKEGSIRGEEADMIEKIVELRDADVAEIMTPRPDVAAVDTAEPLEETIRAALESPHARLPVFRNTRDDIVGVLYVRDLIAALVPGGEREAPDLEHLVRPAYFVPETMKISDLLRQFQERETTLAIVVDEYGGTAGLVTISDIVDTIVGEVRDRDEPPREPEVAMVDPHTLEADARTPVRRLNEEFGSDIPESDEYDTVGGFLCYTLGRVPRPGDAHACGETDIAVLKADERRVHTVRIVVHDGIKTDG
jgi:magnesium and cobalt transporter